MPTHTRSALKRQYQVATSGCCPSPVVIAHSTHAHSAHADDASVSTASRAASSGGATMRTILIAELLRQSLHEVNQHVISHPRYGTQTDQCQHAQDVHDPSREHALEEYGGEQDPGRSRFRRSLAGTSGAVSRGTRR